MKKKMITLVNGAIIAAVVSWFAVASHANVNSETPWLALSATTSTINY